MSWNGIGYVDKMYNSSIIAALALTLLSSLRVPAAEVNDGKDHAAQTFNGIKAAFALQNPSIRKPQPLKIRLLLRNSSDRTVEFTYTTPILHIRIYDATKKLVEERPDAPVLEPVAYPVRLAPNQKYETILTVDLWTFYELPPSKYYLRFYYDLRLLDDKAIIRRYSQLYHSSDLVLWDTRYYSFSVVR